MSQVITAANVEQLIHHNDTIVYPTAGGQYGTATVVEIELIGAAVVLEVLPVGATHTVKLAPVDVTVIHSAMDLAALTAYLGVPADQQEAVARFTGEAPGHMFSLAEAVFIATAWDASGAAE